MGENGKGRVLKGKKLMEECETEGKERCKGEDKKGRGKRKTSI